MAVSNGRSRKAGTWGRTGSTRARVVLAAAGIGGLTGIRSMAGPTVLSWRLERPGRLERLLHLRDEGPLERALASEGAARLLPVLAAGEVVADKMPWVPARTDPLPLLGRAMLGAMVGAVVARRLDAGRALPAVVGAAAAVTMAALATSLRRRADEGGISSTALGWVEDGVVLAAGVVLARAVE